MNKMWILIISLSYGMFFFNISEESKSRYHPTYLTGKIQLPNLLPTGNPQILFKNLDPNPESDFFALHYTIGSPDHHYMLADPQHHLL